MRGFAISMLLATMPLTARASGHYEGLGRFIEVIFALLALALISPLLAVLHRSYPSAGLRVIIWILIVIPSLTGLVIGMLLNDGLSGIIMYPPLIIAAITIFILYRKEPKTADRIYKVEDDTTK